MRVRGFWYPAAIVSIASISSLGCLALDLEEEGPGAASRAQRPIIGGEETDLYPSVALIEIGPARCTATLISDTVLLTAAHCVYDAWVNQRDDGLAFFGPTRADAVQIEIDKVVPDRLYRPQYVRYADVGLVRLVEPAPEGAVPMAWNREPLGSIVGSSVTVVGYGVTDGASQTGAGSKRLVQLTVDEEDGDLYGFGDGDANICQGDSGGPTFLDIDGVPTVIGVSSFGSNFCQNRSFIQRTEVFADFIDEVVQAWSGPCQVDSVCVTEGCGTYPDPDCGTCGFEGVCGANCPNQDLDCPHRGVPGDLCEDDEDCELGMCVPTEDKPDISMCSEPCDPAGNAAECTRAPDLCVERDGQGVCVYSGITPTTQGARCDGPEDCRSGICDTQHEICVEPCDGECPDPYSCENVGDVSVCTLASSGGCCQIRGNRGGPAVWGSAVLAAFVMLFLWRPKRKLR